MSVEIISDGKMSTYLWISDRRTWLKKKILTYKKKVVSSNEKS
jgi:hypothetical protein